MKRTIFPYNFAPYYPMGIQPCSMYVDVANRIYYKLKDMNLDMPDEDNLKKEIAINIAIYYEDKMSGIGLWNAFVSKHLQMYQSQMPFLGDREILDTDDVNATEIELLIWLVLTRNFEDRFLNPLTIGEHTSSVIMQVLTEDDEVEENVELYDYIYNKDKANDYFKLKHVLIWLRRSYLLCSPLAQYQLEDYIDSYARQFSKSESIYYAESTFSMAYEIGPLALAPHQWLAEMYLNNDMKKEAEKLLNLKYCQQDIFAVAADSRYATLKDSKGEEYRLLNVHSDVFRTGSYVYTALAKYGDYDWEVNGVVFNANKEAYEKMCERNQQLAVSYDHSFPLFMKRNNGKRIAYFENKEQLGEWLQKVAPEMDMKELFGRLPGGSQVAFISRKAGIIFAPHIIHAIKSEDNPYYGKCDARRMQTEIIDAVLNMESVHPELLNYLIDNNMLQDGDLSSMTPTALGKAIFTQNIDFIARNHRRQYYHDHDY